MDDLCGHRPTNTKSRERWEGEGGGGRGEGDFLKNWSHARHTGKKQLCHLLDRLKLVASSGEADPQRGRVVVRQGRA